MDPANLAERFWSKVDKRGPDECFEWTAAHDSHGYGQIDKVGTHRVAWELAHGPIPDGLYVCHHCDNPGCVNPAHLFLGTQKDNIHDALGKGRLKSPFGKSGEKNLNAKLTNDHVYLIHHCLGLGCKQQEIADVFGVHFSTISAIKTGKNWSTI